MASFLSTISSEKRLTILRQINEDIRVQQLERHRAAICKREENERNQRLLDKRLKTRQHHAHQAIIDDMLS